MQLSPLLQSPFLQAHQSYMIFIDESFNLHNIPDHQCSTLITSTQIVANESQGDLLKRITIAMQRSTELEPSSIMEPCLKISNLKIISFNNNFLNFKKNFINFKKNFINLKKNFKNFKKNFKKNFIFMEPELISLHLTLIKNKILLYNLVCGEI